MGVQVLGGVKAEIWGRRSRKTGGLPPAPPLVGASLPYDPRKVMHVGVEWLAIQTVWVIRLALRSLLKVRVG